MYNYAGNIHIHSTYSDGSGDIGDIAAAASSAGLSYIIICDHETIAGLHEESFKSGVAVLVGAELNREKNHYLVIGLDRLVPSNDDHPQAVIDAARKAGAVGFIAHPFERGSRYIEKGKAYPWTDWPVFGFDGMEIWNYTSYWRGLHPSLFKTLYWFFIDRRGAMKGPPRKLLQLWDCYNKQGHKIVAIAGSDAHAYPYRLGPFKVVIFPYAYIFTTINTYVVLAEELSIDYAVAKKQIISALEKGSSYISFDSLHPGRDFTFYAREGKKIVAMGDRVKNRKETTLYIKSPSRRSLTRLLCSGEVVLETRDQNAAVAPRKPGVYRVELYYRPLWGKPRPWIYSNPIFL